MRTVSDRVEFVLDGSGVSNLVASTDVGSRRVITTGTVNEHYLPPFATLFLKLIICPIRMAYQTTLPTCDR